MNKLYLFIIAVLALAISFALANGPGNVYAQDGVVTSTVESPVPPPPPPDEQPLFPDELPETASGLLGLVEKWLLFVSGLVATHVMAGVKGVPWLGKQSWFLKLATELVAGVTASVVAFLLGNVAVALGFLDASGIWQVVLYAWPAAVAIYHGKKLSKAGAALAQSG